MDDSPFDERQLQFPTFGVDGSRAFVRQTGETTPEGVNVRSYDRLENRKRGGSRTGLARWINGAMPGAIQGLGSVVATGEQFVIGYFPFAWPSFVLDPISFAPIRTGGSGYPGIPGIVPTLGWTPSESSLFEDEAFAAGHLDAAATNPADATPIPGSFVYSVGLGELFGSFSERTVLAVFTPTDTDTFRSGQAQFTFARKQTPTKVVWAPPTTEPINTVIDGTILNATGANLATSAAVPGAVSYDIYYFDPDTEAKTIVGSGDTMDVNTTYFFKALFRPTDSVRFKVARKEVAIVVGTDTRQWLVTTNNHHVAEARSLYTGRRQVSNPAADPSLFVWCEMSIPGSAAWRVLRGDLQADLVTWAWSETAYSGAVAANGTLTGCPLAFEIADADPAPGGNSHFLIQWRKAEAVYAPYPTDEGLTLPGDYTTTVPPVNCSLGSQATDPIA